MTRRAAVQIVKPPVTWILVADGRRAQVFIREKVEKHLPMAGNSRRDHFEEVIAHEPIPVEGMKWEAESADNYQVGRNATGMVFESASSARHMGEPHLDVREEIKRHFAKTIAEQLNQAKTEKAFDRLVLVVPSKMMSEIKKQMSPAVAKSVVAELQKDLTHCENGELAHHLESIA